MMVGEYRVNFSDRNLRCIFGHDAFHVLVGFAYTYIQYSDLP
jgi:hypothetical protein